MCEECARKIVAILNEENPLPSPDNPDYDTIEQERQVLGMRLRADMDCPADRLDKELTALAAEITTFEEEINKIRAASEKKIEQVRAASNEAVQQYQIKIQDIRRQIMLAVKNAHYKTGRTKFALDIRVREPDIDMPHTLKVPK